MKFRQLIKKINNRGSSLMFVLIAIAFVSILTAVIVSAATTNYRLKVMNNRTQKTFYSAEIALEEVYAGFGKTTCDTLEECYLDVAQNLTDQVLIDGKYYAVNIDNEKANRDLKKNFFTAMYNELCGPSADIENYLSAYLTDPSGAKVIGHGDISYKNEPDECYLIIEDVVISYKEGNYDYFSTVAVDITVKYPDDEFDFISNTKSNLQTFLEFSIIAMNGVDVGDGAGSASFGTIAGGLYAGNDGIDIDDNSKLVLGNTTLASQIVTPGNVDVMGEFDFQNGDIWCKNFNVGKEDVNYAKANFQTNTRVFVADDLNIEGNDCEVSLGKEFIGYGFSGTVEGGSSSAIVINGRGSRFSALSLSKFVLAGRAFIDFDSEYADNYMTADSLGLKGIQKIYLVPVNYLKHAEGYSNAITNPTENLLSIEVDLENFYARELLAATPYRVVQVDEMYYFYLNFESVDAQRKYVKTILSDSFFNSTITNKGPNYATDRSELKNLITTSMNTFILTGVIDLGFNADAKYYTAGNLYEVTGGVMNSNENTENIVESTRLCLDKSNRFAILNSYLYDIGRRSLDDGAYSSMPATFNILGTVYSTGDLDISVYDRIIDKDLLDRRSSNYIDLRGDNTISAVIVEGTYTVPDSIVGGVIVGYGCDIVVKNSFEGLIITNGKVTTITDSGELITNGIRDVASRILDEDLVLSQYFYAYQMQTTDIRETSNVAVEDILSFDNWRKNYAE